MTPKAPIKEPATRLEPTHFQFTSSDGLAIACAKWSGHHEVRGVVQIAHGLGEHIGRYAALAEVLVRGHFVVYGNDHRGHGLTAKGIAKEEHPGKPYILLGHSMGSFAAQQFILEHSHSIDGLALSGSGVLDGLARLAQSVPVGADPMKLMNAPFEPARTPFDWLSRDNAEVDAFVADPLCFPALRPASMESFLDALPRLADPREIRKVRPALPIYILSGSDDPVGQRLEGVRALENRYRSAGMASISHDFYEGGRHEMLHELNRRNVITNLLVWLSSVVKRSS